MNIWFKCVVKIEYEDAKGNTKYRKEDYIVHAVSPTDVEAKMNEHLKGFDFEIASISQTKIVEIVR